MNMMGSQEGLHRVGGGAVREGFLGGGKVSGSFWKSRYLLAEELGDELFQQKEYVTGL
jgi:hypothetical protein